ncbi:MAG: hypothetical protein PHD37_00430 [Gallionellaceae bacterium]|nr:hypothetical protein [Gallionellaceae bacterium]
MKKRLFTLQLASAILSSAAFAADTVPVGNAMKEAVRVYWTAAGCAHIVDGKTFVCDSQMVSPGGQASYTFKGGTSLRRVAVAGPKACDGGKAVDVGTGVVVRGDCSLSVTPDKPGKVVNHRGEAIKLKWAAAGCAGVVDGVTFVCRAVTLAPGESDSYAFPPLTSLHLVTWTSASCPTSQGQRWAADGYASRINDTMTISDSDQCIK